MYTRDGSSLVMSEKLGNVGYVVSPNPTHDQVTLAFDQIQEKISVSIHDTQGRLISESNYRNVSQLPIQLGTASGVYFVGVQVNVKTHTVRVVKR